LGASQNAKGELDALFTTAFVEMEEAFRRRLIDGYKIGLNWRKISNVLDKS